MKRSCYDIGQVFKISAHEAYSEALKYSNANSIRILETDATFFEESARIIYETKERLLSSDYITDLPKGSKLIPIDRKSYLYFLYDSDVLVYIGKSDTLLSRVATHYKDKKFDSVGYVEIEKKNLSLTEELNIFYYKPIINQQVYSNIEFFKTVLKNCLF